MNVVLFPGIGVYGKRPDCAFRFFLRVNPLHHLAKLHARLLNAVLALHALHGHEVGAARLVFLDPVARDDAALYCGEDIPHLFPGLIVDDPQPGHVVILLGGAGV